MYMTENKRRTLIRLIDLYLGKTHIKSRYLFKFYKDRLLDDKYLTEKQFTHLSKYLVHDMNMTKVQVRQHFSELIDDGKNSRIDDRSTDLTLFMV